MRISKTAFLLTLFAAGIFSFEAKGQATIGADLAPQEGVLPELKTHAPDADNATTGNPGGGLGLPRVKLTDPATPEPFLPASTSTAEKTKRAGLTVYNVSSTAPFKPGVHVWDGAQWTVTGAGETKYLYLPSCNIPVAGTGAQTPGNTAWVNNPGASLATVSSPENGSLYAASQLDYVITYYDRNVFENISITYAGLMSYSVKPGATVTGDTFFNIVFIVK